MLDTGFAIVRRTWKRARGEGTKVLESGDKEHLHHRLMEMGHGHRRAVVILWAWTTILSGLVLYPIYFKRGNALIPVGIAGLAALLFTVLHPRLSPPETVGNGLAGPADGPLDEPSPPEPAALGTPSGPSR
jgi:UDP-GlcNAc:undecaprenyl-phosphate GlcNAc-1-phosphate transferase